MIVYHMITHIIADKNIFLMIHYMKFILQNIKNYTIIVSLWYILCQCNIKICHFSPMMIVYHMITHIIADEIHIFDDTWTQNYHNDINDCDSF